MKAGFLIWTNGRHIGKRGPSPVSPVTRTSDLQGRLIDSPPHRIRVSGEQKQLELGWSKVDPRGRAS